MNIAVLSIGIAAKSGNIFLLIWLFCVYFELNVSVVQQQLVFKISYIRLGSIEQYSISRVMHLMFWLVLFLMLILQCEGTTEIGDYIVDCSACNSVPVQGVTSYSCKVRCDLQGKNI